MESSNSRTWTGRVGKVVNDLDPRTVRLRDPGEGLIKRPVLVIVPVVAFLVLGAVAFGASGGVSRNPAVDEDVAKIGSINEAVDTVAPVERVEPTIPDTTAKRPMNFHDPLYVFCDETAYKVSAYPLADPPGVVVNLDGVPEPEADAKGMVGKDSRIRAVRRRVTSTGIRYILRLDTPIRRIRIIHEGAVIIILPVS